jgi:hypothetical protein
MLLTRRRIGHLNTSSLAEWERCGEYIEAALAHAHGTHDLDDVLKIVLSGEAQFWAFDDAAIVTEIIRYPKKTVLRFWLAGGNLETLTEAEPKIIKWSEQWGCQGVEIFGRKGWVRALNGYKPTSTIMVKDI